MAGPIYAAEVVTDATWRTGLDSLASSATAGWCSPYVDNTSNKYQDAQVQIKITMAAGTPANSKAVFIYLYAMSNTTDTATTGAATGDTSPASATTGAAITFLDVTTTPTNFISAGWINIQSSGVTQFKTIEVAQYFGGTLPTYWGIALVNHTGQAFSTSCAIKYTGITYG